MSEFRRHQSYAAMHLHLHLGRGGVMLITGGYDWKQICCIYNKRYRHDSTENSKLFCLSRHLELDQGSQLVVGT